MTQNESTVDVQDETQESEAVEETTETTEETDTDETGGEESEEGSEPTAEEKLKAKDAEIAKLKRILAKKSGTPAPKPQEQSQKQVSKENQYLTREEGVLLAQGYDDKDLETLKTIANGKGISLLEAKDDELFKAYSDKKKADEKKQKSTLGASKGSGSVKPKPEPKTREEHKEMWMERMGLK